jgi:hypothetical protein
VIPLGQSLPKPFFSNIFRESAPLLFVSKARQRLLQQVGSVVSQKRHETDCAIMSAVLILLSLD